jgi:beta-lactamase regulating signal transducer with metallopeptidase domain
MTPDLEFWARTLTVLALEMGLVVGLAAVVAPRLAAAGHRRLLWLGALTSMLLILAGEISGIAHSVSRLATSPAPLPAPGVIVTTTDTALEAGWDSVDAAPAITLPSADITRPTPATGRWWPGLVWLAGTLILLAYRALGHARLLQWDRRPSFEVEPELREQAARLAERIRLRPVTLHYWTGIRGPLAYGLLRPSIALPRDFAQRFNAHQRDAILLHELAHLAARDPLALVFADVVGALAWWHPAVHWARRQLQAAMEAAADEASTLVPEGRTALAESLVRLARELTTPETARGLGVAGASNRSQLAGRVEALLSGSRDWRRTSWRARCATAIGAVLVAFALMVPSGPGRADAPLSRLLLAATQASDSGATSRSEPSVSESTATSPAPTKTTPSSSEPTDEAEVPPAQVIAGVSQFPPNTTAKVEDQLDRFVLSRVHFPDTPLSEVVRELRRLSAEVDPEKYGVWFHLVGVTGDEENPAKSTLTPHDIRIRMKEPLRNANLRRIVDAIVAASEAPITYQAGDYGVSFMPRRPEVTRLITRIYRLHFAAFFEAIGYSTLPDDEPRPPTIVPRSVTNDFTLALGKWLNAAGISMAPPNGFFLKSRQQWLAVRATESEQAKLEVLLAPYTNRRDPPPEAILAEPPKSGPSSTTSDLVPTRSPTAPPPSAKVTLEVQVVEITARHDSPDLSFDWLFGHATVQPDPVRTERPSDDDPAAHSPNADSIRVEKTRVEGEAVVVSEAQWKALLQTLESRGAVTMQVAPRVTTEEGLSAQVQILDSRTLVTGVETNTPDGAAVNYVTETFPLGPFIGVAPSRKDGGWHLKITGAVSGFLGYDDPGKHSLVVHSKDGTLYAQLPMPRLRVRSVLGEGTVPPGHSLLIRGPVTEQVTRTKGSWFRPSRTDTQHCRLYIVVTPIKNE